MDNYKLFVRQYVENELVRRHQYTETCEDVYYKCLASNSPLTSSSLLRWQQAQAVETAVSDVLSAVLRVVGL